MARQAVKLLLLDEDNRLLLIHSRNPRTGVECWYPVGGGIEAGESLQDAAVREAYEETGLCDLPTGTPVWWRDHMYEYDDQRYDVHEEWLLHRVKHFEPTPAALTEYELRTIAGFRWWSPDELLNTTAIVFPPQLGRLLADLLTHGIPPTPVNLTGG